jgi:hypothetical protein
MASVRDVVNLGCDPVNAMSSPPQGCNQITGDDLDTARVFGKVVPRFDDSHADAPLMI